ncbi:MULTISPECIES: hypothetical protein [unclassified Paenibacillus]|uniref:hypothetical protein n=1 Tax=unclassified Paenibacillus TaxID=185978 RepID=UPI00095601FD|nr:MULTISPECIES: hypothetical protein [unclassified Paenibacillus]ASS65333.1 hypothetical protein CIC07_03770 [Paenibacillus sp. RUD330]SIQ39558.1 hypothetical protein SAMN05880555_1610 [Paenibacillus sp. RU4X]SIQ61742.1 hypothetical protein SAMN05880570_1608 [Paenibacillus sp. RU4T]
MFSYILVGAVILAAIGATLAVGFSKENQNGNPAYDRAHGKKWARLSMLYAVTAVLSVVALIWFVFN